ncbi:MAG: hypothetical protein NTV66_05635 [Methylococcales bacterium]|nr:hypothetical protein [Methylococcales bacterium]
MNTLQEEAEYFRTQQEKYAVSEQEISALVAEITEITKYEITKAFLISNKRQLISIKDEISELAGDNKDEIARIRSALYIANEKRFLSELIEDESKKELVLSLHENKEPTFNEQLLSFTLMSCVSSLLDFKNGDTVSSIESMALSSELLGMYRGRKDSKEEDVFLNKIMQEKLNKYQRGAKNRSTESNKKWVIANKYFIEEIPNYKTLTAARAAAAKRAGIVVTDRRLAKMMPTPPDK